MHDQFVELIDKIGKYIGPKRLDHTIGVYNIARALGERILPDKVNELCTAALLHDIAKELPREEQLSLIENGNLALSFEDYETLPALHSFAGAVLAEIEFSEYVSAEVLSAIFNHTLGDPEMSLFDKIIFISDYIEDGRRAASCVDVRNYVFSSLNNDPNNNIKVINTAIIKAINYTEEYLAMLGKKMNSRSSLLRDFLAKRI